ncbi:MAG: hypothetical protein KBF30_05925 [Hyphomonadaceae bacterium]|nr:hypothetical protein [Hyphomonadaceae bacterium]
MRIGPRAGIALALAAGACGTRVEQVASGARDIRSAVARQVDGAARLHVDGVAAGESGL